MPNLKTLRYTLETSVDYENAEIVQALKQAEMKLSSWMIKTREEEIKKALIKLGWTPPPQ